MKTVTKVRHSMTLRELQKALEEIGFTVMFHPRTEKEVPFLDVWK